MGLIAPVIAAAAAFCISFGAVVAGKPDANALSWSSHAGWLVDGDDPDPLPAPCQGTALGKSFCPNLTCSSGSCSGNWYSVSDANCLATCAPPLNRCCGWYLWSTTHDCKCVSTDPEGNNTYSCAICNHTLVTPW